MGANLNDFSGGHDGARGEIAASAGTPTLREAIPSASSASGYIHPDTTLDMNKDPGHEDWKGFRVPADVIKNHEDLVASRAAAAKAPTASAAPAGAAKPAGKVSWSAKHAAGEMLTERDRPDSLVPHREIDTEGNAIPLTAQQNLENEAHRKNVSDFDKAWDSKTQRDLRKAAGIGVRPSGGQAGPATRSTDTLASRVANHIRTTNKPYRSFKEIRGNAEEEATLLRTHITNAAAALQGMAKHPENITEDHADALDALVAAHNHLSEAEGHLGSMRDNLKGRDVQVHVDANGKRVVDDGTDAARARIVGTKTIKQNYEPDAQHDLGSALKAIRDVHSALAHPALQALVGGTGIDPTKNAENTTIQNAQVKLLGFKKGAAAKRVNIAGTTFDRTSDGFLKTSMLLANWKRPGHNTSGAPTEAVRKLSDPHATPRVSGKERAERIAAGEQEVETPWQAGDSPRTPNTVEEPGQGVMRRRQPKSAETEALNNLTGGKRKGKIEASRRTQAIVERGQEDEAKRLEDLAAEKEASEQLVEDRTPTGRDAEVGSASGGAWAQGTVFTGTEGARRYKKVKPGEKVTDRGTPSVAAGSVPTNIQKGDKEAAAISRENTRRRNSNTKLIEAYRLANPEDHKARVKSGQGFADLPGWKPEIDSREDIDAEKAQKTAETTQKRVNSSVSRGLRRKKK